MTAEVAKIDSNVTGCRIAAEETPGVLPAAPVWYELEPNSYQDFGGQLTTVARNPINPRRSRKKGTVVDLDAAGGIEQDLTQQGLSPILPGVFMAVRRSKARNAVDVPGVNALTAVENDGTSIAFEVATGDGADYRVNDLIWCENFTNSANNGLKVVTAITGDYVRAAGLVAEATPPDDASIRIVGHQFASGDLSVTGGGGTALPTLNAAVKDLTQLNLIAGEWIFIGGDTTGAAGNQFTAAHNNGFARVRAIASGSLTIDKTDGGADGVTEMATEVGGTKTIQLFFGDVLRNESSLSSQFKKWTWTVERTLGDPRPTADAGQTQSEAIDTAMINQFQLNIAQASKITAQVSFIAADHLLRNGDTGEEPLSEDVSAVVVSAPGGDAFNTSSDFSRMRMALVPPTTGAGTETAPTPLFTYITEATFTINNNCSVDKAVAVLGGFDVTIGTFEVGATITAYFNDVEAVRAVRENSDVTMDLAIVKTLNNRNCGILLDLPLVALGDGRLAVEQNRPVTLPLSLTDGEDPLFLHSALLQEFWYLPEAAGS